LPQCWADGKDRDARAEMMLGAHLAAVALANVAMAIHHGLCHVLGGSAGVAHGIANAIVLPHAMRFNAEQAAPELAQAAEAMGLNRRGLSDAEAAHLAADAAYQLVGQMNLPQRLRDVGVPEASLPGLAALALESKAVQSNPRPVESAAQVEALFREMW
jgi:alcohol dehydrogenase class IV